MPKFRALLKQQLFELLSECFLEWLEVREHAWTSQHCASCHKPYAYKDAQYCAFCGTSLLAPQTTVATEPALNSIQPIQFTPPIQPVAVEQQQTTDPLQLLPPGTLVRAVHQESRSGQGGTNTQVLRAIRKVQLAKEPLKQ